MEKVCTCDERTFITDRHHPTVSSKSTKDNRPNGSAVRGLWYHRSGSKCSILLKERRPSCKKQTTDFSNQKANSLPIENCVSKLNDSEKLLPSSDEDGFITLEKCSKLCESGSVCVTSTGGSYSSSSSDLWDEEIVLRHIKECRCTCNHMGYGNYLDWKEHLSGVPPAPPGPRSYGSADTTIKACVSKLAAHPVGSMKRKTPSDGSLRSDPDIASDKGSAQRSWCLACMLVILLTLTGVGVVLPLTARMRHGGIGSDHLAAVKGMLREVPLIDGHNDLAWNIRKFVHNQLHRFNFSTDLRQVPPWATSSWSQTDLPRLQEGMLGAQFWSAYVPCDAQFKDAVQLTLEQINLIRRLADSYSALQFVTTAQGIEEAHRNGQIASLIGVEGGHSLGASLGVLRAMYDLGVRYLTLTHTCNTPWADSSSGGASESNTQGQGLTAFGKVMIRELNRLGMVIDLSHAALDTVLATLNVTRSPVIFSHSSAQALCNTSRNVPDSVLKLMADNGGVVMVSFYNDFLTCSKTAHMEDVIRHLTHIRDVAGEDHVGIGAGYDGINRTPVGLEDVSRYPILLAELAQTKDWTISQLEKLAGKNILRVLRRVEKVKEEMRKLAIEPYEEWVPPSDMSNFDKHGCLGR
ncbi:dipeptidase 1 [Anabrus simplex]|uniref:dipeptidase 1 n=1 Tax=Anabrus simplex TaxID=316456 RepID=UPI0035A2CBFC